MSASYLNKTIFNIQNMHILTNQSKRKEIGDKKI